MENKTHRFISAKYELYSMEYGNEVLIEKTEENRPLTFYTGCEMALPQFEEIAKKIKISLENSEIKSMITSNIISDCELSVKKSITN